MCNKPHKRKEITTNYAYKWGQSLIFGRKQKQIPQTASESQICHLQTECATLRASRRPGGAELARWGTRSSAAIERKPGAYNPTTRVSRGAWRASLAETALGASSLLTDFARLPTTLLRLSSGHP